MSDMFSTPSKQCDLVMKGGITSGVVYPHGVTTLASVFKFRNIGGTSAGAIAAAAAAAAELGRQQGGFDKLKALPEFLGTDSPSGKGTNLLGFFQPQPQTKSLFCIGIAYLEKGPLWAVIRAVFEHWCAALGASVPAAALLVFAWMRASGWFLVVCIVCAFLLLVLCEALALAAAVIGRMVSALPANYYGLCTGMSDGTENSGSKPLTPWLAEYLNDLAGRTAKDGPLTFGDLWGTRDPNAERQINLEMMTTNLTHGRPYRLPFRQDGVVRENSLFYFKEEDFRKLFPEDIVDFMMKSPRPSNRAGDACERAKLARSGLYPMPLPADLPVVVAVRMSLSFPILLSAVPLYAVDYSRDPDGNNPEKCWFSDGGISSNFPIHFFDSPLPRWPTLSMDLIEKPEGTDAKELAIPWMVRSNRQGIQERWNRFEYKEKVGPDGKTVVTEEKSGAGKLWGFIWAIVATMQNWSDNTLSRLPGYRDRIAHIGLTPKEGGLNLNMPSKRIEALAARGKAAGEEFVYRFGSAGGDGEMDWANHRWIRLRSMLDSIEEMLTRMEKSCAQPQPGDVPYEQWIRLTATQKPPSYKWTSQDQQELALSTLVSLRTQARDLIESANNELTLSKDAPAPHPELRVRPRI